VLSSRKIRSLKKKGRPSWLALGGQGRDELFWDEIKSNELRGGRGESWVGGGGGLGVVGGGGEKKWTETSRKNQSGEACYRHIA